MFLRYRIFSIFKMAAVRHLGFFLQLTNYVLWFTPLTDPNPNVNLKFLAHPLIFSSQG